MFEIEKKLTCVGVQHLGPIRAGGQEVGVVRVPNSEFETKAQC